MTKSPLLVFAATLAIAAGSLGVPASTAAAQPYGSHGYPSWQSGPQHGYGWHHNRHRVCKPVFRTVKVRGHHGWHWKKVVVGQRCFWTGRPHW